ncbi:uncharacterized protein (DUF2342 family) [Paraburkholderia bryophila]|uniref:Uncharacterized protein (DUF2342 family) n=1 Tax=Paraburkholderia bryophila TaxID=420952 RepID=A0A7Y9WBM1_9BURK|nr:uncharacterized protein (DUF2342 family) [Paraburkholderia bryophila]
MVKGKTGSWLAAHAVFNHCEFIHADHLSDVVSSELGIILYGYFRRGELINVVQLIRDLRGGQNTTDRI